MRRSTAQALVESALTLPVLLSLSLVGLQLVLYAHAHNVLSAAVQDGARLAAEDGRTLDDGYSRACEVISAGLGRSVESLRLVVSADDQTITVDAAASLRLLLGLPALDSLPLHAQAHLVREHFRPAGRGRS